MTIREAQSRLMFQLYHIYSDAEAANIADLVMEKITGWKRIDRIINKDVKISAAMAIVLERYISEFSQKRPVQYVLNECWFYGLKFIVDERVLIPRPETEELVDWCLKRSSEQNAEVFLDIGTGSGCIPVAIKKNRADAVVYACDVSMDALAVAKINADNNGAAVIFLQANILDKQSWHFLPACHVIISNPPYIPGSERTQMADHVVEYEPGIALFVEDSDPLIFYRTIAAFGKQKLLNDGCIFVEMHEDYASATMELFKAEGYCDVEIKKDMQQKERMLYCKRP